MRDGQVLLHTSLVRKGERLGLTADIENISSCKVKLKCKLIQIQTFIVESNKNRTCRTVFKASSAPVLSGEKQIMKTILRIPADFPLSISICNIIRLEYLLKVYLDIPFTPDPEVIFPVVLLPKGHPLDTRQSTPPGSYPYPSNGLLYPSAPGFYPDPSGPNSLPQVMHRAATPLY